MNYFHDFTTSRLRLTSIIRSVGISWSRSKAKVGYRTPGCMYGLPLLCVLSWLHDERLCNTHNVLQPQFVLVRYHHHQLSSTITTMESRTNKGHPASQSHSLGTQPTHTTHTAFHIRFSNHPSHTRVRKDCGLEAEAV